MRLLLISFFISTISFAQKSYFFNQHPPTTTPTLFAPNIISDEYGNRDMAISPNGDEIFYTLQYRGGFVYSTIMYSKKINGKWTTPEIASFCGQYFDEEPAFSPDGITLYFSSNRPLTGIEKKDYDIWSVTKVNGAWANPQNLSYKKWKYLFYKRNGRHWRGYCGLQVQ